MNAREVMRQGHQVVLGVVEDLPEPAWAVPNVCGVWASKDILAHLTSFELVLVDIFAALLSGSCPTPVLDQFRSLRGDFNEAQVAARSCYTVAEVLAEYMAAHHRAMRLANELPGKTFCRPGILPWYGSNHALDDFIVYTIYAHKREHCAQIRLFRKLQGV